METKNKKILATDCKCCTCGKQAIAFWPVDVDILSQPYCRECLDKIKLKALIKMQKDYFSI